MSGPIDPWLWPSSPVPNARPATRIQVFKYTPNNNGGANTYTLLDNVECTAIQQDMGIDPGRAMIRYRFTGVDEDAPQSIEDCLASSSTGSKVIEVGNRVAVQATKPDGSTEWIFDGEPVFFGLQLASGTEQVPITLVGAAKETWNNTVDGLYIRDSSNVTNGKDIQTDIPAQFNPKGKANATPVNAMVNAVADMGIDNKFPTFMDPDIAFNPDMNKRRMWTLPMAARYFMYRYLKLNPNTKLKFPAGADVDALLVSREPKDGAAFDPGDPATYDAKDIIASDKPLTGRDWPGLLNDAIRDKGFGMVWSLGQSDSGDPETTLKLSLLQTGELKNVYLQDRGEDFDPERSNVGEAEVHRDINQVVNQWDVKGKLQKYEVSLILYPGFPAAGADGDTIDSISGFDKTAPNWAANADKYRLFVYDEAGEEHYELGSGAKVTTPGDLKDILGMPAQDGTPAFATRRRRPIGDCVSTDSFKEPYKWSVAVSTDYAGSAGKPWDRTGNWQTVGGGVELLDDRIGIRITSQNPNAWKVGKSEDANAPFPGGVVNLVESLSKQNTTFPFVYIRLTCTIEGDKAVTGTAMKTTGSVIDYTINRQVDARDRYEKNIVSVCSEHNDGSPDQTVRDDTELAKAEAIACRVATEAGVLEGEIVIPRFTRYYELGDRIGKIEGRELGFRTDNGTDSNPNKAIYPVVIGIRHILANGQKTILRLSDQDGHRHKIEKKTKRK